MRNVLDSGRARPWSRADPSGIRPHLGTPARSQRAIHAACRGRANSRRRPSPDGDAYRNNGRNEKTGWLGGGEDLDSKDFTILHVAAEAFLSAMVLDGAFERFPRLRCGVIELGALWGVPWMKRLDIAQQVFARSEPHLKLPLKASDYIRRQIKFTPHPTEPIGWIIEQAGDELFPILVGLSAYRGRAESAQAF